METARCVIAKSVMRLSGEKQTSNIMALFNMFTALALRGGNRSIRHGEDDIYIAAIASQHWPGVVGPLGLRNRMLRNC